MKRFLAILMLSLLPLMLFAADEFAHFVNSADDQTLRDMATVRGLDAGQSASQLRSLLQGPQETEEAESESEVASAPDETVMDIRDDGAYSLEILSAENMEVVDSSLVLLSGNVEIAFTLEGDEDRKRLRADRMLLDPDSGRLSAYGNVVYNDEAEGSGIENISASIVTYLYQSGDLLVSGGMTSTERTNNEDEKVTFYTTGDLLNYRNADGGLYFTGGYLTSDPDRAYSSITAGNLALLEGGDMFMTNAYLSIGRVPLLYLPFFFYPGSRLAINPAFGFNSSRGMFLSTTTEIFGTYPNFQEGEESSFSSILRSDSNADMVSNGLYYVEGEDESAIGTWARETDSYLALLADVYQNSGFMLGFDTLVKPVSSLTLSSQTSFVLSSPPSYYDESFRWYTVNKLGLSSSFGNLDLSLPLYSDPYVLRDYSNRLTSFSIDALFGAEQSFPSTVSSTISSYNATLTGSLYLPSRYTNSYVSSLRLSSIRANASFDWDSKKQEYLISDIILPSFNLTMAGRLFNFSTERVAVSANDETARPAVSDYFLLSDPLLYDLYVLEPRRQSQAANESYSVSLSYNLTQRFSNGFEVEPDTLEPFDQEMDSDTTLRFDISARLASWFSLSESLTPSYSYDYDESDDEEERKAFSLLSTTAASIPALGITYNLSTYLYRNTLTEDLNSRKEEEIFYSFDRDNIRTHNLTFSKTFGSLDTWGQLTPSLRYTLPPLVSSIEPRLGYRLGGLTASASWTFSETEADSGVYESGDIRFSLGLSYTHFTSSLSLLYESDEDKERFLDPLSGSLSFSLRTEDRKWSITEYIDYEALSGGVRHLIEDVRTVLSIPYLDLTINYTGDGGEGLFDLELEYIEARSRVSDLELYTWKNRIHLSLLLDARMRYDFLNPYSSSMSIRAGVEFSIAEFLDLTLSITTTNNGFYRYMENGTFSFPLMWEDLMRSFDFVGDGRMNTQFNMQALDLELVHYMGDWDLHFRYTASLEGEGADYGWVPTFAIYLRWRTIPDLKVDNTWEQRLSSGEWERGDSLYSD